MFYDDGLSSRSRPDLLKGAAAGLVGGAVASWVMTQFQAAVPPEAFAKLLGEPADASGSDEDADPATVEAAEAISETVLDHSLTAHEKKVAGPAVHYAFGTTAGAAYCAAAEVWPASAAGLGLPFGTVFWVAADEIAVPAAGLAEPPSAHPPSVHLYALASHLVYGLVTDLVRRGVRRLL